MFPNVHWLWITLWTDNIFAIYYYLFIHVLFSTRCYVCNLSQNIHCKKYLALDNQYFVWRAFFWRGVLAHKTSRVFLCFVREFLSMFSNELWNEFREQTASSTSTILQQQCLQARSEEDLTPGQRYSRSIFVFLIVINFQMLFI